MIDNRKDVFYISEKEAVGSEPAKSIWTKVGMAFLNKDQSLNVRLEALPLNGKLHIRDRREVKETAARPPIRR